MKYWFFSSLLASFFNPILWVSDFPTLVRALSALMTLLFALGALVSFVFQFVWLYLFERHLDRVVTATLLMLFAYVFIKMVLFFLINPLSPFAFSLGRIAFFSQRPHIFFLVHVIATFLIVAAIQYVIARAVLVTTHSYQIVLVVIGCSPVLITIILRDYVGLSLFHRIAEILNIKKGME